METGRKNDESLDKGRIWFQVLAVIAVSLGGFTSGMLFAWSSPSSLVITGDKENYNITEDEASYFIILHPIGMLVGSLFIFKIAEVLGRKKTCIFLAFPQTTSWLITIFAVTKWEFYVARFIAGLADAVFFCSIPPYIGEITTPVVRGWGGNMPTFLHYGGQFFMTTVGSYLDIRTSACICLAIPVLYTILVLLLPESPYQLIKDAKYEKAHRSLKWFLQKSNIENDFISMKADVERQIFESGTWKDLFMIASNRRALRAGMFLRFSQQLCGISVFAQYAQTVFKKAGGNVSSQLSSIIFTGLNWCLNLVFAISVEKFGRKPSYFYSLLCAGISLILMATYFFLDQYEFVNLDSLQWFPLAVMVVWVFSYPFGLGVVPTLMLGELFSTSIKPKGLCALITTFGSAVFISTYMYQLLSSSLGLYSPFFIFGIFCLLSTFLTLKWVPETKGKTLEEIQQALKK